MRVAAFPAFLVACLALAGCSAATGDADLVLRPPETTGSVAASGVPMSSAPMSTVSLSPKPVEQPPQEGVPPEMVAYVPAPIAPPIRPSAFPVPSEPEGRPLLRERIYGRRFRDAKPINFGRASPRVFAVHGVDVSRWQGEIDWQTLRAQGANFTFIKATDGGDHLDPMFKRNWRAAHEAGLRRGAYHFFYWCRSAAEQARWFIRNVPREKNALPPVLDVEWNSDSACKAIPSPAQVQEKMRVFISMVERHYGQRPIIYTAPGFYHDNLEGAFLDYPFWLRSVAQHPSKVFEDRKWLFWQYSGSGLSQGVDGKIDLNVFNGSADAWYRWVDENAG
jgi:lysozyme